MNCHVIPQVCCEHTWPVGQKRKNCHIIPPVWNEHTCALRQKRNELPHYPTGLEWTCVVFQTEKNRTTTGLEWTCVVFQTEKKRTTTLSHRSGVNMCGLSDRKEKNYHIIPQVWSEHVWSFRQKRKELPHYPTGLEWTVVLFFSVWKTTHVHSRPVG